MDDQPLTHQQQEALNAVTASKAMLAASVELSIRRTLARIDRALDVGNKTQFNELTVLLREFKARLKET